MGLAQRAVAATVIACSATSVAALANLNYSFSSGKPGGMVDVALTAGAGPTVVTSNTLREGNSTASNGGYNSVAIMPDSMAIATSISITVTVGSLSVVANNRSVGPGIFSADGSRGIYLRFASQSATATLNTWVSGTGETPQKTSTQVATAGDTLTLTGTLSGGVWTWTVKKNGTDIPAFTWSDSAHVIDLPGVKPGIAFRHQYAAGQAPSRGVTNITATAA